MSHLRSMIAHGYNAFTSIQRLDIHGSKTRKTFCNLKGTVCKNHQKMSHLIFAPKIALLDNFMFWGEYSNTIARLARNLIKWDIFELFSNTVFLLTWHGFKADETNKQAGLCEEGSAASRLMYGMEPRPIFTWLRRLLTPFKCS